MTEQEAQTTDTPAPSEPEQRPDHVDFNDLGLAPEKLAVLERRWGSVYGRMKDMERNFKESAQANKALLDRVDQLSKSTQERTADSIKAQIKQAAESGEFDKLATLTEELVKVTSQSPATKPSKVPEPSESKSDTKEPPPDLSEFASVDEEAVLRRWATERDAEGNPLRPWLQDGHPKQKRASTLIQAVIADPELDTAEKKMAEVDRLMGVQKSRPQAPVLTPSATGNRGNASRMPAPTKEQRAVAEEMGIPIEKYMAAVGPKGADGRMQMNYKAKW